MILHCVYCDLRPDLALGAWEEVVGALETFALSLDGVLAFEHGPNRDFEAKSAPYTAGFIMRCESRAALEVYAEHPRHKALGQALTALCEGGGAGIMVFDLELGAP